MKKLLLAVLFLGITALCSAQGFTYPYVFSPGYITCSPQNCNSYQFLGAGGYGTVSVFATGTCSNGIRPYVTPMQTDLFCQYPNTFIYATAYIGAQPDVYNLSFGNIYAQTMRGDNGTYAYIAGNWVSIFSGQQFNDCYTGALQLWEPPPHPC